MDPLPDPLHRHSSLCHRIFSGVLTLINFKHMCAFQQVYGEAHPAQGPENLAPPLESISNSDLLPIH